MRVCVVAEYYPRPGDETSGVWAHRQAIATRAAGCDVRVLALERPLPSAAAARAALGMRPGQLARELGRPRPRRARLDEIEVEYVRFLSPPRGRSYASWHRYARRPLERALRRLRSQWRFDLVHAHYVMPAGAAAFRYAASEHLPLVVSIHGGDLLSPLLQAPAARVRAGQVLRGAAAVLCNSAATRAHASRLAGRAEHMRVVHLGTDFPARLPPKDERTIATLGHVIPRKRHIDVVEALRQLPHVRWLVIGDGPELPALRAAADGLGVEFLGRLPPAQALAALARARLMVLPSVDEAFGVAYVEALAHGAPAIGVRGEGGPEDIAALTDAMVLVPPRDPAALAAEIRRLLADGEALDALASRGREAARAHFSWAACGEATAAAYRTVAR